MTYLQNLLCNQYAEITSKGKDGKSALTNTTMLTTAIAVVYIFILLYLINIISHDSLTSTLNTGAISGKAMGRLFALIAGVIVFMVLKFGVATEKWYASTVEQYQGLGEAEQKNVTKRGMQVFLLLLIPALVFLVGVVIF